MKLSGANLTAENILPYTFSFGTTAGPGRAADYDPIGHVEYNLQLESLITNGILKTNATLPGADCPTGKCTWPVTPTIGVCSECTRVNDTVTSTSNSICNSTTSGSRPANTP